MVYPEKIKILFDTIKNQKPVNVAVVWPDSKESLQGAILAAETKVINPLLVGDINKIKQLAAELKVNIDHYQIVESNLDFATKAAIEIVKENKASVLMKGSLHTDQFMADIVSSSSGLRTKRRMSHCMLTDIPKYNKLLFITDIALNIFPTLNDKVSIVQNAIDLAHAVGIAKPKVALLSAVESVDEKIPTTIDCAALCKMMDRGQITGAIMDGPLAFDVAIDKEAALCKKVTSAVVGDPDIVVVPNLEAGNILFKSLEYLAGAIGYGVVLGAKVPIILTSRAAGAEERAGSCLLARFLVGKL